jgi:hypothetical protein
MNKIFEPALIFFETAHTLDSSYPHIVAVVGGYAGNEIINQGATVFGLVEKSFNAVSVQAIEPVIGTDPYKGPLLS